MPCPRCQEPLATGAQACPNCGLSFASEPLPEAVTQSVLEQTVAQDSDSAEASRGMSPGMSTEDEPRRKPGKLQRFLIDGVPLWVGMAALIAVTMTFRANILTPGNDWAESALITAYVALALANQPAIHRTQARALENSGQWQAAIREYRLTGEQAPGAPDIARVHLGWGEQLLHQKRYQEAIDLFYLALNDSAVDPVVGSRSLADLYMTYKTWLATRATDVPFTAAALYFELYLRLPLCSEACNAEARELASQAWYEVGAALLQAGDCYKALPYYQLLVNKYGDTASGQKASTTLAVPVRFVAMVRNLPHPQGLHVWLSKTVAPATHDYITSFSEEYAATLDATGTAAFPAVAPGTYNFSLLLPNGFHTYWRMTDYGFNPYTERIGPLCATTDDFYLSPS